MTDLPMTDCCPGSTCPVSSRCLVCDYIDHQCPVWIKVDKSSIHVCPLKEGCRLFRMLMKEEKMKRCNECKWLQKYTAENGSWMNVCESEEPEEIDVGMYYVTVMNADDFDAYDCLNFAKR